MVETCWLCLPAMVVMMDSGIRVGKLLFFFSSFFSPFVLALGQCLNVIRSISARD